MSPPSDARLTRVVLDGEALTRLSPVLEADRAQAVADLVAGGHFAPVAVKSAMQAHGPYDLHLSIWEGRLMFEVRRIDGGRVLLLGLALRPFRSLIKDYQLLVDNHAKAVAEGRESRVQAIDMGRRGLHNEGAALLQKRLDGKIVVNFETARRLFTLVCVLHTQIQS